MKKTKPKTVRRKSASASTPADAVASSIFKKGLLTRGEAVELTEDGQLPLEATHAIIKKPDGSLEIKRARLKTF